MNAFDSFQDAFRHTLIRLRDEGDRVSGVQKR